MSRERRAERAALPTQVQRAYNRGWSVVPQTADKRALVKWAGFQRQPPSQEDLLKWYERWPTCHWAVVTGRRSIVVLDFDGEAGMALLSRLGLRPTLRTPHGGAHVWLIDPPWRVRGGARVDPTNFPGLDVRAEGQVATFHGKGYRWVKGGRPYRFRELPPGVQRLLRQRRKARRDFTALPVPDDFAAVPRQVLLGQSLSRVDLHPRNETGFWLATQLRDERYGQQAIWQTLQQYAGFVADLGDHPYTLQEAYDSMISALSQPARAPRALRETATIELLSEVPAERVSWLWASRIPMRKVSIIEGDPDRGKSSITLDLAARETSGRPMPGETQTRPPGAVLIICAEDDIGDTVVPRLLAAGGRRDRTAHVPLAKDENGRVVPLSIPEDLRRIEAGIRDLRDRTGLPVRLVIIDPITAYLSEKIHYGNDPQVRKAMLPLKQLAEELDVAVLLVRHLNKDDAMRAMYRGGGSIAFNAAARSVLVVERHPEEEGVLVLARVKMNLGPASGAMSFRIESHPEFDAPRIVWGGPVSLDVDQLLRGRDGRTDAPARREAERFLLDLLGDGPKDVKEIQRAARDAGLSWKTVRNAKQKLGVKPERIRVATGDARGRTDKWRWALPMDVQGSIVTLDIE